MLSDDNEKRKISGKCVSACEKTNCNNKGIQDVEVWKNILLLYTVILQNPKSRIRKRYKILNDPYK